MTVADVDICNRALQMIGSRVNILSLSDDTDEARNCNMLYAQVRDQILSMAFWNFARSTVRLDLLKALPGTPQTPITGATEWITNFPDPPWLYTYRYPSNCVQFRYLTGQPGVESPAIPIFSTQQNTFSSSLGAVPQRFTVATNLIYPISFIIGITQANPGKVTCDAAHGLTTGNSVYITSVVGMTEVNYKFYTATVVNSTQFTIGVDTSSYTIYSEGGLAINRSGTQAGRLIINSNAVLPIGVYTSQVTNLDLWSGQALQAFVSAFAGFLAIPIAGDRGLAQQLIEIANSHILQARASDGIEGFTVEDWTPEWIAARNVGPDYFSGGSDLGILMAPYPPLFAVS